MFRIFLLIPIGLMTLSSLAWAQNLSIRNANLIPFALESATNVSRHENNLKLMYGNIMNTFPKNGDISELSENLVMSLYNYGSEFCSYMIQSDMKKKQADRWTHFGVDFNIPPQNWPQSVQAAILNQYSELFWQRSLTLDEEKIINEEFSDLLLELPAKSTSGPVLLTLTCGVFVASPGFLFLGGN